MKFPRSYRDLKAAPWCQGYMEPGAPGDYEPCEIFLDPAWLPEDMRGETVAYGNTLADALRDLRQGYWEHVRAPEE